MKQMIGGLAKATGSRERLTEKQRVEQIVGILFASRDYAHKAHLRTPDYSKHMALGDYYDEIIELADEFAEVGQGLFGLLDIPDVQLRDDIMVPVKGLQNQLDTVLEVAKGCEVGALKNIVDAIQALFARTIYKVTYLS